VSTAKTLPRWPLYLIAAPAAVAVWSGWVGLGRLSGFGVIHPLPGIWDAATVNTSVTLPIGVEAYGAYALGAWLSPGVPQSARRFAKWSTIGSLTLGMLGQVAYHLLSAAHATRAPWPVVVLVSSLPVIVLGFGAALSHLLRGGDERESASEALSVAALVDDHGSVLVESGSAPATVPVAPITGAAPTAPQDAPVSVPKTVPRTRPRPVKRAAAKQVKATAPEMLYAAELAAGEVPSLRRIRADMHVGQPKAQAIQADLSAILGNRVPVGT
jgi:hypothetical protein